MSFSMSFFSTFFLDPFLELSQYIYFLNFEYLFPFFFFGPKVFFLLA